MITVFPYLFSIFPPFVQTVLMILVTVASLILIFRVVAAVISALPFL